MPKKLSPAQVESYERDGFLSPVAALSREEAAACLRKLEAFEATVGGPLTSDGTDARYRSRTHVLLSWVHSLTRHPAILDAVEDLIGPDILVYTSTWFIKEPESAAIAAWHQDATCFGLRPYVHATAWLALTDATAGNGCMEFLPGSHRLGQLPHRAGVVASSVNRAGQAVVGPGRVRALLRRLPGRVRRAGRAREDLKCAPHAVAGPGPRRPRRGDKLSPTTPAAERRATRRPVARGIARAQVVIRDQREHAGALAPADQRERRELEAGGQARRVRRYSAISSVAAIPCGIALVSDTNAWICPGYSRWTTFTPSLRSRSP